MPITEEEKKDVQEKYNNMSNLGGRRPIDETGLSPDYINSWIPFAYAIDVVKDPLQDSLYREFIFYRSVDHYEVHVRLHDREGVLRQYMSDLVIKDSDRERIRNINKLVDKFNAEFDDLKKRVEHEECRVEVYKRIHKYWFVANRLIRGRHYSSR